MKYRIEVTVSADRIGDVIKAVFDDNPNDPELKIYGIIDERPRAPKAAQKATARKKTYVLPGDVAGIERPVRVGNNKGNKRQEILEAALKTGPKRWSEMRTALSAGGLSESSLNNLIGQWKKAGKIARSQDGLWSMVDAEAQRADAG
jgi:hypothetical protein